MITLETGVKSPFSFFLREINNCFYENHKKGGKVCENLEEQIAISSVDDLWGLNDAHRRRCYGVIVFKHSRNTYVLHKRNMGQVKSPNTDSFLSARNLQSSLWKGDDLV